MKVFITPQCYAQIMYYVMKAKVEISGLGRVQKANDGSMVVTSIYLLKQENGPASTDIDPEALATLQYESRNDPGDLNFWWHSHVDMQVFWSGTDMSTIYEFGSKGYLLATVFNKKAEYRTAYFQGSNGFLPEVFVDDLDTDFEYLPSTEEKKTWETNFETLCKEKSWGTPVIGYTGPGSSYARGVGADPYGDYPSHFNDPHYWGDDIPAGKSKAPEISPVASTIFTKVVGRHTQLTTREMSQQIRVLRTTKCTADNLDMSTRFMLWDLFEILNGFEIDDDSEDAELSFMLAMIHGTDEDFDSLLDGFWEEVAKFKLDLHDAHIKAFDAHKRKNAAEAETQKKVSNEVKGVKDGKVIGLTRAQRRAMKRDGNAPV